MIVGWRDSAKKKKRELMDTDNNLVIEGVWGSGSRDRRRYGGIHGNVKE